MKTPQIARDQKKMRMMVMGSGIVTFDVVMACAEVKEGRKTIVVKKMRS
jgi:hypothetical protein